MQVRDLEIDVEDALAKYLGGHEMLGTEWSELANAFALACQDICSGATGVEVMTAIKRLMCAFWRVSDL